MPVFSLHVYGGPRGPQRTTNIEKVTVDVLGGSLSLVIMH